MKVKGLLGVLAVIFIAWSCVQSPAEPESSITTDAVGEQKLDGEILIDVHDEGAFAKRYMRVRDIKNYTTQGGWSWVPGETPNCNYMSGFNWVGTILKSPICNLSDGFVKYNRVYKIYENSSNTVLIMLWEGGPSTDDVQIEYEVNTKSFDVITSESSLSARGIHADVISTSVFKQWGGDHIAPNKLKVGSTTYTLNFSKLNEYGLSHPGYVGPPIGPFGLDVWGTKSGNTITVYTYGY